MSRHFGIDFGTTTTAFVAYDPETGQYDHIGDHEGNPFRSILIIDQLTGELVYRGLDAWKQRNLFQLDDSHIVMASVKQELSSGRVWRTNTVHWQPEMAVTEILKEGVDEILRRWPDTTLPIKAVMAVPVDFEYEERKKIKNAAINANIEVTQFVSEPSAALVGWEGEIKHIRHAIVFDWGGGTLDVSVTKVSNGKISEHSKKGIRIGGDAIDDIFARYLHNQHREFHSNTPPFDGVRARRKDRMLIESERNKCLLSTEDLVEIYLPNYCGDRKFEEIIDRETFEDVIQSKIQSVMETLNSALSEESVSADEIDQVLMVGGSSNIPIIRRRLDELFGARCVFPDRPGWLIARGAAKLSSNPGSYRLSKSYGIVLSDNSFLPVLERDKPIDHENKTITLGLVEDSREAKLIIAESPSIRVEHDNYHIIDALLMNIPVTGYYFEPIEVSFRIKRDLSLQISAAAKFRQESKVEDKIYPHLKFIYDLGSHGI